MSDEADGAGHTLAGVDCLYFLGVQQRTAQRAARARPAIGRQRHQVYYSGGFPYHPVPVAD